MIRRISKKRAERGEKYHLKRSAIRKKPRKPIRKVNPKAKAKRKIAYRKMLASQEYRRARELAFVRAGDQCEYVEPANIVHDAFRCCMGFNLHAHHLRYPKVRPLEATDLLVVCKPHHEYLESQKMGKTRMY